MKREQLLEQNLNKWTAISGLAFVLLDEEDNPVVSTGTMSLPDKKVIEDFRDADADTLCSGACSLFHIKEGRDLLYILAVSGPEEKTSLIGPLAVCQVESLLAASSSKNDKNRFLQEILLGHVTGKELEQQARHFHITMDASRILLLIETSQSQDSGIHSIIRTVLGSRTRDHLIPMSDNTCAVLREADAKTGLEETDSLAHMLVGTLNTEAMVKARVSYSNAFMDLSLAGRAHQEAVSAMEIGRIFSADRHVSGYAHLGIGRLIYQLPKDICEIFVDEILQAESLDSLDEETLNIIRTFFDNNLNLSETSRQLYVHRNTLVYRFEKLEKKYGLDIRSFEDALLFKLAMLVSDYLFYLNN